MMVTSGTYCDGVPDNEEQILRWLLPDVVWLLVAFLL